jgi:TRAP-type C4-dicarboxylate transport system permease small subunit
MGKKILGKGLTYLDRGVVGLIVAFFSLLVIVGGLQVGSRYIFGIPLVWSEELQKFLHIWIVFLAIPLTYSKSKHIQVDTILLMLHGLPRKILETAFDVLWLGLGLAFVVFTWQIMAVAKFQTSPALGLSMDEVYSGILIGGVYLIICSIRQIVLRISGKLPAGEPS